MYWSSCLPILDSPQYLNEKRHQQVFKKQPLKLDDHNDGINVEKARFSISLSTLENVKSLPLSNIFFYPDPSKGPSQWDFCPT